MYSFAIILYEINGRKGPYGNCTLDPKGWCAEQSPLSFWMAYQQYTSKRAKSIYNTNVYPTSIYVLKIKEFISCANYIVM